MKFFNKKRDNLIDDLSSQMARRMKQVSEDILDYVQEEHQGPVHAYGFGKLMLDAAEGLGMPPGWPNAVKLITMTSLLAKIVDSDGYDRMAQDPSLRTAVENWLRSIKAEGKVRIWSDV